jgi:hypothetical protein
MAAAKDDLVKLRLPATMAARWRVAAAATGTPSLSEWLRDVGDAAASRGVDVPGLRAEIAALRADLGRGAGNLLDQIATKLNTNAKSGLAPDAAAHTRALTDAAVDIAVMRARLDRTLAALARRRA